MILSHLERRWTLANKGALDFCDAMRQREAEFGIQQLFDVRSADICRLFNFSDADDL